MEVPEFLRSLAEELRRDLLDAVELHWKEIRALEAAWTELSAEFDGEDPVHPTLRDQAAQTAAALRSLATEFGGKRRLVEPDETTLGHMRGLVDGAFERLDPLV
jgi:hypothetical protein